jgi:hypothetical protein
VHLPAEVRIIDIYLTTISAVANQTDWRKRSSSRNHGTMRFQLIWVRATNLFPTGCLRG